MAIKKTDIPMDLRHAVPNLRAVTIMKSEHNELIGEMPAYETCRLFLEMLPPDLEREGIRVVEVLKAVLEQSAMLVMDSPVAKTKIEIILKEGR